LIAVNARQTSHNRRRTGAVRRRACVSAWLIGLVSCLVLIALPARAEPDPASVRQAGKAPGGTSAASNDAPPADKRTAALVALPKPPVVGDSRALYRSIIEREVRSTSLPADVAEAVMGVESGYDPTRIGADGEIGLMQVMPATARMLGFSGSMTEFAAPEINIRYGIMYLSQAWNKAGGDLCTALMKYRAGHGETRFSHLSVEYCLRARARLVAKGYQVTGIVPTATFGAPMSSMARCRGRCLTLGGAGRVDFAALNNRLTQVVMQVGPKPMAR
jgi:hypothetical protein